MTDTSTMSTKTATRRILARAALAITTLATAAALTGCNTMTGLGQDIMLLGHHAQVMVQGDDPVND